MKWDELCFNGGAFGNKVSGAVYGAIICLPRMKPVTSALIM
jgi:hypothetical protein